MGMPHLVPSHMADGSVDVDVNVGADEYADAGVDAWLILGWMRGYQKMVVCYQYDVLVNDFSNPF